MNTIKTYLVLLLIGLLVLGFTGVSFGQDELFEEDEVRTIKGPKWAPGEIIVKFKRGLSEDVINQINQRHGTSVLSISKRGQFMRLVIPRNRSVEDMVSIYSRNPNVEYAEPNFIASALMTPNDPYYSYQWHLDNSVYGGIHMESAWDIQTGNPDVVVAVVDTGVAYESFRNFQQAPDLANTSFIAGYDFVNNDTHPNDDEGHGTHVAGTVAQSTNNNIGVAGVAFNVSIMPLKVLDATGSGTYSDVADGIYFAADNGAAVINLSLGGTSPSTTLENAVAYAYNKGVTIVCAAGNEYQKGNSPLYPAAYDAYCIAVGATRFDETRAYYSNTGTYLDIAAPGGDLNVDQNNDGYGDGVLQQTFGNNPKDFGYWFYQGTSMASPHVAGVAALLISDGVTGPDNIRAALQETAEDKGTTGRDDTYGWGLVDAHAALGWTTGPDTTPPAKVTGVSVITVSDSELKIDWTANTEADLDHYNVYRSTTSGFTLSSDNLIAQPTTNSYSDTGLAAETTYYYRVSAVDKAGNEGTASDEASGTTEVAANVMYVGNIVMSGSCIGRGPSTWCKANAVVTITDGNTVVADATVSGRWSGAYTDDVSGTTDADGKVAFETKYVKGGRTFEFCVTDVTKTDWSYDSSKNFKTCGIITLPK